jgi:hypothetical protein
LIEGGKRGDAIEFQSVPPTEREIAKAVSRYSALARQTEGRDEGDVAVGLRDEMKALGTARRSATSRLMPDD